ncbi:MULTISPECIES: DUF5991 domain-containing protein [unclassified Sphingomonas]|uniref:DUF5991 domain-containing protein n=1 Tax=unclassified Sphingomonas TaxID=196159 RepID=UPI000B0B26A0|nr:MULTISPECIES: DUF5991 domain-containing protein [unclassified Sphingomonas]
MRTRFAATTTITLSLAAMAATFTTPASAQDAGWNGRYVWEENVGRHGGNTPTDSIVAFITYTLGVGPGNGPTGCTLNGQGFQTNKRIRCTVTPQGKSIVIKFHGYGADNMFDSGYRRGQALFTLTRTPRGLVTALQALTASADATPRTGKLFYKAL